MNIYYVGTVPGGCYYYRCYLPMLHNGWDGNYISMYSQGKDSKQIAKEVMQQDIVVYQRPSELPRLDSAKLLQQAGKKIVFDNDDTYKKLDDRMNFKKEFELQAGTLDEFIEMADLVTTTTETLAKEYRKLNKNVVVLPNFIDPDDWDTPLRNDNGKVRIGLVGSVTHNKDYEHIKELIEVLAEIGSVELVVMGMREMPKVFKEKMQEEIDYWAGLNIEWVDSVVNSEYPDKLNSLKLDLMLIPRADTYFNKCKSNCKFLEASMCEIPVIAQTFGDDLSPYDNNDYLITANTPEEWEIAVLGLMVDVEWRKEIGKKARVHVIENYNIEDKAHLWKEAYKKLV